MQVAIYSIPHTGTRFVSEFLRHCGVVYSRQHVTDPAPFEKKWVVPVRNPYECYLSHRHKNPPQGDAEFLSLWGRLMYELQGREVFYVPLDIDPARRHGMLKRLLEFCEVERDIYSFEWQWIGKSNRDRSLTVPDDMLEYLKFAYEWYEDKTRG